MKRLLAAAILLCGPAAAFQDAALCVLFDLSESAQEVREAYRKDFEKLVDTLAGGERIFGAAITSHSLATGRFEIDEQIPKFSPFSDSRLTFGRKLEGTRKAVKAQAGELLKGPATKLTDLMGAMRLAEKAFGSAAAASAKARYLVVFSDMIEESARYNFVRDSLTSARIGAIVAAERNAGRLPALNGVQVWAVGADGATPEKYDRIQNFWIEYFRAAGAELRKNRYGAGLMDFSVPRK